MGFYGNSIVRYVTNMFKKIRVGNKILTPENQEDTIELKSQAPIIVEADEFNNTIEITHAIPQAKVVNPKVKQSGQTVTFTLPEFDDYGHYSGQNATTIEVGGGNATTIRAEYAEETGDLKISFE